MPLDRVAYRVCWKLFCKKSIELFSTELKERPTRIRYFITEDKWDINDLLDQITLPSIGMVRGVTTRDGPHETEFLEYESYKPMAEAKMRQVAREIRERWDGVEGIAIIHVLASCTRAHRLCRSPAHCNAGVFDTARYGIDRLKEIVIFGLDNQSGKNILIMYRVTG